MTSHQEWYRDSYLISTAPNLIQPAVVNAAFDSDDMYWTKALPEESLKQMLSKSLCFGLYQLPTTSSELAGRKNPTQIGLARFITDEVTFAYLTDVFVVPEHQKKGLGTWLIECVNEWLDSMPHLRRAMLISSGEHGKTLYANKMGMGPFQQGSHGLVIMNRKGPGAVAKE